MLTETITSLWWDIVDFVYPQRCPVCQATLSSGRELMCQSCFTELQVKRELLGPYCPSCKRRFHHLSESCGCRNTNKDLGSVFSLGSYGEEMEVLIESFKYRRKRRLGTFLSEALGERLLTSGKFPSVDVKREGSIRAISLHVNFQRSWASRFCPIP